MTTIRIHIDSLLPPGVFLHAARDFSARRTEVFPAVRSEHFIVHDQDASTADVTEGTPAGIGINWERCRYDWSDETRVLATVIDSNTYRVPGSAWELTAHPTESGSRVEMTWTRRFRGTPRGVIFGMLFRTVGRPLFAHYAKTVVHNVERLTRVGTGPT